jgi:hypothetical protein
MGHGIDGILNGGAQEPEPFAFVDVLALLLVIKMLVIKIHAAGELRD